LPGERERRRIEAIRADQELLRRSAAWLRSAAIQCGYAGLQHQHVAFGHTLILDELAAHLPELPEGVRWQAVESCRVMLGEPMAAPTIRRTRRR
jgi:hypothetical protein